MKIAELLTELRHSVVKKTKRYSIYNPETGETDFHPDGVDVMARNFYEPSFRAGRAGRGDILGTIGDWLKLMGATKEDIAPARAAAVASPEYQRLIKLGFKDVSTPGEIKVGTIAFTADVVGTYADPHNKGKRTYKQTLSRKVHINGNIRTQTSDNSHHAGRGKTLHPMTAETHPSLTPVERLSGSMRQSMRVLAKVYGRRLLSKALDKMENPNDEAD